MQIKCPYCSEILHIDNSYYELEDGITRSWHCKKCNRNIYIKNCKVQY